MLLSENNIKAELSYAYLHAVASRAGFGCQIGDRHEDGIGVDAKLRVRERFGPDSKLTQFSADVQLKTVYLPMRNFLSVENLRELMARFSRMEVINYER